MPARQHAPRTAAAPTPTRAPPRRDPARAAPIFTRAPQRVHPTTLARPRAPVPVAPAALALVGDLARVEPADQPREPRTAALPDRLRAGVEALSGVSMADVTVHYGSPAPALVDARAFARGSDIHLAHGHEQDLPHEAWHVAQQRQGRVAPTSRVGDLGLHDSAALEHEATVLGTRAAATTAATTAGRSQAPPPAPARSPAGVVQRAILIGRRYVPRVLDRKKLSKHFTESQLDAIALHAARRHKIYVFKDNDHFLAYYSSEADAREPKVVRVSDDDLARAHTRAQNLRFAAIYKPAAHQLPDHAPGAHTVPQEELPPSGPGHHWARTTDGADEQYTLWTNKLAPPAFSTELRTFGDPDDPSIWSSQGAFNMGGRVMPTRKKQHLADVPRSRTTYGHLDSETGYVRGHPMCLEQQQRSTEPGSSRTFDNTPELYTRESDGTKGGFSTFRYNQVERPAARSDRPFNQVNVSSDPQRKTAMGISPVDTIHLNLRQADGSYAGMTFDNTVDYRDEIGRGNKFHARLARHVASTDYPHENVYTPGEPFLDPDRHTYAGYQSPPPTPLLTDAQSDYVVDATLPGRKHMLDKVEHDGKLWIVTEASYDASSDSTTCRLERATSKLWEGL